jgi:inhibitor of KinA sporulation pathway (predicted exonuclease)
MKILKSVLDDCQHLLFIDLEGTQFGHEVIAIGAVLIDCDKDYIPVGKPDFFKCYVKANTDIGTVIEAMTGITDELLEKEGISFEEAMERLNTFLGHRTNNLKMLTYGDQDCHMLSCSYKMTEEKSPFLKSFIGYLLRNNVDMGTFFSRYIRGKKNELVSLTHMREFFSIPPSGEAHDPLVDATDLYHIYEAFSSDKELIKKSYKKLLKDTNIIPQPIKTLIVQLVDGKDVSAADFDKILDIYFE